MQVWYVRDVIDDREDDCELVYDMFVSLHDV